MASAQVINTGRQVVLVDIENLVGGGRAPSARVEQAFGSLEQVVQPTQADLVFVAAAPPLAMTCGLLRPGITLWSVRGRHAAELCLMREVPVEFVAERADALVIASGDHEFVDYAVAARSLDLEVTIIGPRGGIHHTFWTNGFRPVALDLPPDPDQGGTALAA